ncbi:MAG: hypothetical protein MJ033_04870 [Victivallaceae bacterium]|nr:hypothetical protein [Victivallaceae bacterium]
MSDILIRDFTDADLNDAGRIALTLWGDEIPEMPQSVKPEIYRYLARYYFAPDSPFNLAAEKEGQLCGCLLAALPGSARLDALPQKSDPAKSRYFGEYRRYLDGNRAAEEKAARKNEIILLFFTSIVRGAGKLLLAELENRLKAQKISSILLWTDETCDFDYYFCNGFAEAGHFASPCGLCGRKFETWLFRKSLS